MWVAAVVEAKATQPDSDLWVSAKVYDELVAKFLTCSAENGELRNKVNETRTYLNNVIETRDQDREFLQNQVQYLQGELSSIQKGMMNRLGLSPQQEETTKAGPPRAVQTRTAPWSQKAATLEADARAEYYKKKIDEVEQADQERAQEP